MKSMGFLGTVGQKVAAAKQPVIVVEEKPHSLPMPEAPVEMAIPVYEEPVPEPAPAPVEEEEEVPAPVEVAGGAGAAALTIEPYEEQCASPQAPESIASSHMESSSE